MPIRSPEDVPTGEVQDPGSRTGPAAVDPDPDGTDPDGTAAEHEEHDVTVTRPQADPVEQPAGPVMPSFASLRDPRRRAAVDLLVPGAPPAGTVPRTAASPPRPVAPPPRPAGSASRPEGAPRPAEWGDLLRLGVRVARCLAGVPGRAALWSVRQPARRLRGLLGE